MVWPNTAQLLERVGADLTARHVAFKTADDFRAASIWRRHCIRDAARYQICRRHIGLFLRIPPAASAWPPTGLQIPNWMTAIEVTNIYPGGFWEKAGFGWFAGI